MQLDEFYNVLRSSFIQSNPLEVQIAQNVEMICTCDSSVLQTTIQKSNSEWIISVEFHNTDGKTREINKVPQVKITTKDIELVWNEFKGVTTENLSVFMIDDICVKYKDKEKQINCVVALIKKYNFDNIE